MLESKVLLTLMPTIRRKLVNSEEFNENSVGKNTTQNRPLFTASKNIPNLYKVYIPALYRGELVNDLINIDLSVSVNMQLGQIGQSLPCHSGSQVCLDSFHATEGVLT